MRCITWALAGSLLAAGQPLAAQSRACADSATAAYRVAHVLPAFADSTPEAMEWRTIAGVQQISARDAEVVRDADLCTRIDQQARAWHNQATNPPVFGDYTSTRSASAPPRCFRGLSS